MADERVKLPVGFLVSGIALPLDENADKAISIARSEMKRAGINPARLRFRIYKKSVDARKKNAVKLVYSVAGYSDEPIKMSIGKAAVGKLTPLYSDELDIVRGSERAVYPPLVVGMGPAGLFCALLLAENGYAPIIIDRGDCISERVRVNRRFIEEGVLDRESNIQFGAGGAGTFSDGKLLTRVNDARISYILRRFCDFGAPEEILTQAKPHIGTDMLVGVVDRMLARIEELGGRVIYRCRLDAIGELADRTLKAKTTRGDICCSALVLAVGHSARDTYEMLMREGFAIESKPFSVGFRIEHRRSDIEKAMYGDFAGHPKLSAAEYHLSDTTDKRGVYTFCMCPGGQVVAGASEEGGVVVNGMSNFKRDGENSNSAVLASVFKEDVGSDPRKAIAFQRALERRAFELGGGDYCAPVQTVGDFLSDTVGSEPSRVTPSYRDGRVRCADVGSIFPEYIGETLRRGLLSFDKKLCGFAAKDAVITGVETRTSAPLRIIRGEDMTAVFHRLVYPCGEGAGYAGGITSSALDGIKTAMAIMARYAPADSAR